MYPIDVTADYGDGQRSRGLAAAGVVLFLKALLLLPHLLVVGVLNYAAAIISYIGYWVIFITGELPDFFYTFPLRVLEWQVRIIGWLLGWTDDYPPFVWEAPAYPASIISTEGPGPRSRLIGFLGAAFFLKAIAMIPHAIAIMFVMIAAMIATWVGYVVVLVTGKLPEGIFNFTVGTVRWSTRISAWLYSLTDEYPPFRMSN